MFYHNNRKKLEQEWIKMILLHDKENFPNKTEMGLE